MRYSAQMLLFAVMCSAGCSSYSAIAPAQTDAMVTIDRAMPRPPGSPDVDASPPGGTFASRPTGALTWERRDPAATGTTAIDGFHSRTPVLPPFTSAWGDPVPASIGVGNSSMSVEPPLPELVGGSSSTKFKLGIFLPSGDIERLDDGIYGEITFSQRIIPLLSVEGSIGYLAAEGPGNSELSALPLFVNARLGVPITILEVYGGVGVGAMWTSYDTGFVDETDWVGAWQGFLGLEVGFDRLAAGIEGKYMQSSDTDADFQIEGTSVFGYLKLSF